MKRVLCLIVALIIVCSLSLLISAEEKRYYLGTTVNTGKDNGYSEKNEIDKKDPHWNWTLGNFFVSGFSEVIEGKTPVFLKTVGDEITLYYNLTQNINKLNNNSKLTISEDTNGYDHYFQIDKSNFGKGTLIVKHTDYQNFEHEPTIYTNFLSATAKKNADTKIIFLEEGDYEIALDYEIKDTPVKVFGASVFPSYENYRVYFKFSVRNGNCMVFPFDVATGAELTNSAFTENGFYLDLAKSKYLNINIKKEVLTEGVDGLTEDVRFNRPAKDGEQFTEEGIYTITVSNTYTNEQTVKKLYVGNNDVLKAHVTTGLPISEINKQKSLGFIINDNGTLTPPEAEEAAADISKENADIIDEISTSTDYVGLIVVLIVFALIIVTVVIIKKRKSVIPTIEEEKECDE